MQSSVTKYVHPSYALRHWDSDHNMTCRPTGDVLQQDSIYPLASLNSHFTDGVMMAFRFPVIGVTLDSVSNSLWKIWVNGHRFFGGKNWRVNMCIDTMESQGLSSRRMRLSPQAVGSRSENSLRYGNLTKDCDFSTMAADPSLLFTCFFFWIWKSSKTFAGCLSILSLGTQRASSNYSKSLGPGTLGTRLILLPITIIMPLMFK